MLCVLTAHAPLISAGHRLVYHYDGSAASLFVPTFVDLGALWIILAGLALVTGVGRWKALVGAGVVLILPWMLTKDWSSLRSRAIPHGLSASAVVFVLVAGWLAWRRTRKARVNGGERLAESLLIALSLAGVLMVAQLAFFFWRAGGLNDPRPLHRAGGAAAHRSGTPRRVIVLLMDELSYEQVFGRRAASLQLPGFDALAGESVVFGNVRPESEQTEEAVPSLLSGLPVTAVRSSADGGTLRLRNADHWANFEPTDTIFSDALRAGYRTGVSGWFNPYCRILARVLDECEWTSPASLMETGSERDSILVDSVQPALFVAQQIGRYLGVAAHPGPDSTATQEHLRDYRRITASADRMLAEPALTFIFLHLPIPHPGGIYDRRTGAMPGVGTSYLDNLALADRYLAHVRDLLERQGAWRDSTVVVTGDHSWRTNTWARLPEWTPEDAAASRGGQFDDRPGLVVKLAGETMPGRVDTAFQQRRVRAMLKEIVTGRIETVPELERWAVFGESSGGSVKP